MSYFEFPHTRTYDTDLGWLIKHVGQNIERLEELRIWAGEHKEEYKELADKVQGLIDNLIDVIVPWDSSIDYKIFSVVEYQGINYIAVQDVPIGTMITNTDYWQPANTVVEQINAIAATVSEMSEKYTIMEFPGTELYIFNTDYGKVWAVKINKQDRNGNPNIPKVFCENGRRYTLRKIAEKTGSAVLLNGGFFGTSGGVQTHTAISDGIIVADISEPHNMICINAAGELAQYPATTPASEILEAGYINACSCWGRIVHNAAIDNDTITGMSEQVRSDTSQQNFGVDADGNYWIITTAYTFNRNMSQTAAWIIDNIPGIQEVYSMDGGGSTGTISDNIFINDNTDLDSSEGRAINSAIYFDNVNRDPDNIQDSLGRYAGLIKEYMTPAKIINIRNYQPATGLILNLIGYQIGQLVMLHGLLTVKVTYEGGWKVITEDILPPVVAESPATDLFTVLSLDSSNAPQAGRLQVAPVATGTLQKDRKAHLEFRAAIPAAGDVNFDIDINYVTPVAKNI